MRGGPHLRRCERARQVGRFEPSERLISSKNEDIMPGAYRGDLDLPDVPRCPRCRPRCVAYPSLNNDGKPKMARKLATRVEFTLFDVVYEDGSQRSNRRVPSEVLGGLDGDAPARAIIEEQDRLIAERSGTPAIAVKSVHRSGSKKADEAMRSSRYGSASD